MIKEITFEEIDAFLKELPELSGTEKQIAWANKIRSTIVKKYLAEVAYRLNNSALKKEVRFRLHCKTKDIKWDFDFEKAKKFFLNKKAATYWIDRRDAGCEYFNEVINNTLYDETIEDEPNLAISAVDAKYFEEIYDFAKTNDFKFSQNAIKKLKTAELKKDSINPQKVQVHKEKEKNTILNDILNSPKDIIEDLKEND